MSSAIATPSVCDFCHQKPKFGGYPYCGKTCAAQAAALLCAQCHQKPKYGNYEYCGKKCAVQAQAVKKPPAATTKNVPGPHTRSSNGVLASRSNNVPSKQQPIPAQYISQQPALQAQVPQASQTRPVAHYIQAAAAQIPRMFANAPSIPAGPQARGTYQSAPPRSSFYGNTNNSPTMATSAGPPFTYSSASGQPPAMCRFPGCNEPAHVDADGSQTSDFCSMKHREDAAVNGLVPLCIMCGELPQSKVDHFCGRTCRESALTKPE
ncbi:hypothetical protein AcW1_008068 [Taiwanofungus camphoratus]|nr:hypothetical protein AcW1_008068 [Antrodia cinnamomea]